MQYSLNILKVGYCYIFGPGKRGDRTLMGPRPNFSLKLEPIHRTLSACDFLSPIS